MQDEALHAPIKVEDRVGYFCQQWRAHRRDTEVTARLWTNMSLVGVEDDGSFSSVQVHQAVFLPPCKVLASAAADLGQCQDDLVILLPDTPVEAIKTLVSLIYDGGCSETTGKKIVEVVKAMKNLGLPITSLVRGQPVRQQVRKIAQPEQPSRYVRLQWGKRRNPLQEETRGFIKRNSTFSRLKPDWSDGTPDISLKKVTSNPSPKIPRHVKGTLRKIVESNIEDFICQICEERVEKVKELVQHYRTRHAGASLLCSGEGCQFQCQDIVKLREHQFKKKHFQFQTKDIITID